jgi:hypothetical protein
MNPRALARLLHAIPSRYGHFDRSSIMPQKNEPITRKPKVEDESTGKGSERHGVHSQGDEALPGGGDTKGGLGSQSGASRSTQADSGGDEPRRGGGGGSPNM